MRDEPGADLGSIPRNHRDLGSLELALAFEGSLQAPPPGADCGRTSPKGEFHSDVGAEGFRMSPTASQLCCEPAPQNSMLGYINSAQSV